METSVGYRRLALRVIDQALRDLESSDPNLSGSALAFLTGDPLLFLWCDLAEIGPSRIMARAAAQGAGGRCVRLAPDARDGQTSATLPKLARAWSSVS